MAAAVGRVKVLHRYPGNPLVFGAGPPRPFVRGGVAGEAPPAVEKALRWMSQQQATDGSFAQDEEISGLCLLAFLAAGHTPDKAPPTFHLVLRRGFARLLTNVRPHPIAELALGMALERTGLALFNHMPWSSSSSVAGPQWRAWVGSTLERPMADADIPTGPLDRLFWIETVFRQDRPQGPRWKVVFADLTRDLSAAQAPDGSWGDLRTTAFNVLTLCTERRFGLRTPLP